MVVGSLVGKLTRVLVEKISSKGSAKTYCISFSLGAHVCGFIGKEYKLTGILGLDPSKLIFETSSDDGRLSKNDAKAVFVFHTNYKAIGIKRPIGHVDFYVNGGGKQEVECGRGVKNFVCHHMYSFELLDYTNGMFCGTNVFCPAVRNASSIKGIKFPEIDIKRQVVKEWTTLEERSSSAIPKEVRKSK